MKDFEPKPFGKYYLTRKVAVGGMAEIYKAKTFGVDGFEKTLAIKKILPQYSADREFITMLTDEAKLVVNLSHANIVQVYDLGRVGNDYFISMEYIEGINIRQLLDHLQDTDKKLELPVCLFIVAEICKGLDYAHHKKNESGEPLGIIHRDVSPHNILVSRDGGIKLVDFGIAKAAMNLSQTNMGMLKGKVTYMSPEQAFGKPMDHRTDIFSLGIILYEMISGERLFRGDSQMEILKKIRNTKIDEAFFKDNVPKKLRKILAKALAYKASERYMQASDLQIDLQKMLYADFPEFSARQKLIPMVEDLYQFLYRASQDTESSSSQTFLIASQKATSQTQSGPEVEILAHTLQPSDAVSPKDFLPVSVDEPTVRSEITFAESYSEGTEKISISLKNKIKNFLQTAKQKCFEHRQKLIVTSAVLLLAVIVIYGSVTIEFSEHREKSTTTHVTQTREVAKSASIPQKSSSDEIFRTISISSVPTGAMIFIDDKDTGLATPAQVPFKKARGQTLKVKVDKEGYKPNGLFVGVTDNLPPLNIILDSEQQKSEKPMAEKQAPKESTSTLGSSMGVTSSQVATEKAPQVTVPTVKPVKEEKPLVTKEVVNTQTSSKATAKPLNKEAPPTKTKSTSTVQATRKATLTPSQSIKVSEEPDILLSKPNMGDEFSVPVAVGKAGLRVDSYPSGSAVKINGAPRGVTPIVLKDLTIGQSVTIEVSKPGYGSSVKSVTLKKNWQEIKVQLK